MLSRISPQLLHKRRKRRDRSLKTLDPAHFLPPIPPGPQPVLVSSVHQGGATSYLFYWTFDAPFQDEPPGGGPWTAADFVNLMISNQAPTFADEVIGSEGLVGLVYDNLQDPDQASLWELVGPVPKLVFPDGRPLPLQDGTILH